MAKTTRKELLKAPDEFITTTGTTVKWIKENPLRFGISAMVAVVVIAGAIGFYYWKTSRDDEAMIAYSHAWNSSQLTLEVMQKYGDTDAAKLSRLRLANMAYIEKNPKMALSYAQEFLRGWGGEDAYHWEGILIQGSSQALLKDYQKAIASFDDCIQNGPQGFKDQALFYKAQALIALGRKAEARKALESVSDNYKDIAMPVLASLETQQGVSN
jgi:tetratricopeptide (TPR) repeat protein